MKIKRILCFVLAVIMVASLSACAGASVPAGVNDEGQFVYSVVRSAEKSVQQAENGAKLIRATLRANFDCKVNITFDNAIEEDFEGNYEILVGDSNRKESAEAKQRLIDAHINNAADFIVAVIGDKICIQAISPDMFDIAVDWFLANFGGSLEDWAKLKKDYEFIYHPDIADLNATVAGMNIGKFTVVLPRKNSLLIGLAADEIIEYYDNYGYAINQAEDMDAEVEYEILIGDCDREASKAVTVEGDNYVIKVAGKKLVIKGGSDLATWRAVKAFYEEIEKNAGGDAPFNWADGHTINGKYDANEEGAYTLNWYDEFEGSTIDLTKWSDYRTDNQNVVASALGGSFYKVNVRGESKYAGNEKKGLIYQNNGHLYLGSKRVNDKDFLTSTVSTYWTMTYKYGIMDVYAKLAPDPAYSTLWVNASDTGSERFMKRFGGSAQNRVCMAEIDLMENYSRPYEFSSTVHWWWAAVNGDGSRNTGTNGHNNLTGKGLYKKDSDNSQFHSYNHEKYGDYLPDDFHLYSFYWDDKGMKFAFDGKIFLRYNYADGDVASVNCLMNYLIMDCGLGSATYGTTYDKDLHGDYYEFAIDYVRIYQTDAVNSQMITAWPETKAEGTSKVFYPEHTIANAY